MATLLTDLLPYVEGMRTGNALGAATSGRESTTMVVF